MTDLTNQMAVPMGIWLEKNCWKIIKTMETSVIEKRTTFVIYVYFGCCVFEHFRRKPNRTFVEFYLVS